jgi:hypothetical protein
MLLFITSNLLVKSLRVAPAEHMLHCMALRITRSDVKKLRFHPLLDHILLHTIVFLFQIR